MSLALAAQHLAARGRNGDSTLVHMTPGEVAGLHALAHAHGKKLTINPETGLPEAFSLKSLLPMIGGAALSMIPGVGPLMAAGIMGGGTALATGSLQKGLMAGLGAYGGAGIGGALAGAGASAANTAATNSILGANPGLTAGEIGREMGTAGFVQPQLAANVDPAAMSITDKMTAGFKGLGTEAGRNAVLEQVGGLKGLGKYGLAALSPAMMAQTGQAGRAPSSGPNPYSYTFDPGRTGAGPSMNSSESLYFKPRYLGMAEGGSTGMTGQSDEYYRYLMGLAPRPMATSASTTNATADASAASKAAPKTSDAYYSYLMGASPYPSYLDPSDPALMSKAPEANFAAGYKPTLYEKSLARLTPAELATHYSYLTADRTGPAGLDPTTANEQAQMNMIDPVTGQPNGIVSALVPLANMLNITNPQNGFLVAGIPGAALGNAAVAAQNAQMAAIAEQGMLPTDIEAVMNNAIEAANNAPGVPSGGGPTGAGVAGSEAANVAEGMSSVAEGPVDSGPTSAGAYARGGLSSLAAFAQGGYNLGDYSDGGRLLRGPGDGVSDSIPASIANKRPARLADGEFVVPARIVSELGNGSTEAGARKLYAMMDRVQKNRSKSIGKGNVAVNSRSEKLLPA